MATRPTEVELERARASHASRRSETRNLTGNRSALSRFVRDRSEGHASSKLRSVSMFVVEHEAPRSRSRSALRLDSQIRLEVRIAGVVPAFEFQHGESERALSRTYALGLQWPVAGEPVRRRLRVAAHTVLAAEVHHRNEASCDGCESPAPEVASFARGHSPRVGHDLSLHHLAVTRGGGQERVSYPRTGAGRPALKETRTLRLAPFGHHAFGCCFSRSMRCRMTTAFTT